MSEDTLTITIQGDSEGYVVFECPFCGAEFKLNAEEYQSESFNFEDLFCPYCGLTKEKNAFLSSEVVEQMEIIAYNHMVEMLNDSFGKISRSINKSGKGMVKMKFRPLKKYKTAELKSNDSVETEFECSLCNNKTKVLYCAGSSKIYCPYCGVDI